MSEDFVGFGECRNCGNKYAEVYKHNEEDGYIVCECNYAVSIRLKGMFSNNQGSMFTIDNMDLLEDVFGI